MKKIIVMAALAATTAFNEISAQASDNKNDVTTATQDKYHENDPRFLKNVISSLDGFMEGESFLRKGNSAADYSLEKYLNRMRSIAQYPKYQNTDIQDYIVAHNAYIYRLEKSGIETVGEAYDTASKQLQRLNAKNSKTYKVGN